MLYNSTHYEPEMSVHLLLSRKILHSFIKYSDEKMDLSLKTQHSLTG